MRDYLVELELFPKTMDEDDRRFIFVKLPASKLNKIILTLSESFNINIR